MAVLVRRVIAVILAALFLAGFLALSAGVAGASVYTKGVYAPYVNDEGKIEAWADVQKDCDDTEGCWAYVKIEWGKAAEPEPRWFWFPVRSAGYWYSEDARTIDEWADTYGGANYPFDELDDLMFRDADGRWAGDGWNKVVVPYQGCGFYRMTVDTYHDKAVAPGAEIEARSFTVSPGGVFRVHEGSHSELRYICKDS